MPLATNPITTKSHLTRSSATQSKDAELIISSIYCITIEPDCLEMSDQQNDGLLLHYPLARRRGYEMFFFAGLAERARNAIRYIV